MPRVTVLFFAGARQRAGTARVQVDLQDAATVHDAATSACASAPTPCALPKNVAFALNSVYAEPDAPISDGDEVAILPPVSGGASDPTLVEVTADAIDPEQVVRGVASSADGAVVVFHGVTRDHNAGRQVVELEYEAYSPMAEDVMRQIIGEARERWDIAGVAVVHRTGVVAIGETSMCLAIAAPHRDAAYAASQYFVDELKQQVPIWKKERFVGGEVWINDSPG